MSILLEIGNFFLFAKKLRLIIYGVEEMQDSIKIEYFSALIPSGHRIITIIFETLGPITVKYNFTLH
jgi:hypothetical protein